MRRRGLAGAAVLAAGAAAVGYATLRSPAGARADARIFGRMNEGHGPGPDRLFAGITELGSLYACGAAAVTLAVFGHRRAALSAGAAAATTWALGQGAKRLVSRPRPYHADPQDTRRMIAEPRGTSWPSSHPAVLTAFTHVAANELGLGTTARAALSVLDAGVAASRVYLGVHYPSDVVSGLLMGRALARAWPCSG